MYSASPSVLEYTPIAIKFREWMQDADSSAVKHSDDVKYRLRISPPRSNRKGEEQYIADSIIVNVPDDGIIRLKLLPSDRYLPIGEYVVEYYRSGCSTPIDVQKWVVPSLARVNYYSFVLGEYDPILPIRIWRVLSVTPGSNWVSEYNNLSWRSVRPAEGEIINIEYTPAATLDQLLQFNLNDLSNQTRIRV